MFSEWSRVPTQDNAADIISRGCTAKNIGKKLIWWVGPEWLIEDADIWPKTESINKTIVEKIPEEKGNVMTKTDNFVCTLSSDFPLLAARSSLKQIIRITAYCLRWRRNGLKGRTNVIGPLEVSELEYANSVLIKMIQRKHFQKEIKDLKSRKAQVAGNSGLVRYDLS